MGRGMLDMIKFDILTLFPEMFDSYFSESIIKRAIKAKKIRIERHNFRDAATDKHHTVDDRPYGGGPGMILKFEPIAKTLRAVRGKGQRANGKSRVIMLTPAGKQFDQATAKRLSKYKQIVLLCGRYEGFDARIDQLIDEKISIGPYVLSGGELPAMVVIEAVARYVPGVLGHADATKEETHSSPDFVEYPQYTRPEEVKWQMSARRPVRQSASGGGSRGGGGANGKSRSLKVPKELLTGNHAEIKKWRDKKAKG